VGPPDAEGADRGQALQVRACFENVQFGSSKNKKKTKTYVAALTAKKITNSTDLCFANQPGQPFYFKNVTNGLNCSEFKN
jgi:hypothetical protein